MIRFISFTFYILAIACPVALAQVAVTDVRASQRAGSNVVDIHYNVTGSENPFLVSVELSGDGGTTYSLSPSTLSGDIGTGITLGTNRHIIWNAGADLPDYYGPAMRFRVSAIPPPSGDFPFFDTGNFDANGWDVTQYSFSNPDPLSWRIKWDQYLQPPNSATKSVVIPKGSMDGPIILVYDYAVSNNRLEVYVNDHLVTTYQNNDNKYDNGDMPFNPASHDVTEHVLPSGYVEIKFVNDDVYKYYNHTKLDNIGLYSGP